ncbi:MAG: arginine repressor [Actinobacteria bacterium]|nr:arginine repressor [Actinomycetota bacterium]
MTKRARQGAILRLIEEREIATQDALVSALADEGFEVTQTTVSRDLNELGLGKVRTREGHLVYARGGSADGDRLEILGRALQRWVLSISASGNMVVIHTLNGYADPVAQAIDEAAHPDVLGTVAGENTVLIVTTEGVVGGDLATQLTALSQGQPRARAIGSS